jgi:hypothetical protein
MAKKKKAPVKQQPETEAPAPNLENMGLERLSKDQKNTSVLGGKVKKADPLEGFSTQGYDDASYTTDEAGNPINPILAKGLTRGLAVKKAKEQRQADAAAASTRRAGKAKTARRSEAKVKQIEQEHKDAVQNAEVRYTKSLQPYFEPRGRTPGVKTITGEGGAKLKKETPKPVVRPFSSFINKEDFVTRQEDFGPSEEFLPGTVRNTEPYNQGDIRGSSTNVAYVDYPDTFRALVADATNPASNKLTVADLEAHVKTTGQGIEVSGGDIAKARNMAKNPTRIVPNRAANANRTVDLPTGETPE